MNLLVMDLTGPISVPTWNGYLYALVVVEVSCYYTVSCLLKEKEEASITIQNIIVMNLFLRVGNKNNSCSRETQENLIEFLVQSSLPYILLLMVHAHYCVPYPNDHVYDMRPTCVVHAV